MWTVLISFCTLKAFVSTPIRPLSGPGEFSPEPATEPLFGSFLIASEYFSKCWIEIGSVAESRCDE
uniref:Secreted protein n=1 Tax=Anopheles dirus TaxID=7168 RepID=A0A182NLD1_9DIPT